MKPCDPEYVAEHLEPHVGEHENSPTISIAISLKRIADRLEQFDLTPFGNQLLDIAYQAGVNFRGHA